DGEAARGQRGGEVHGDGGLPDAALSTGDRQHAGGRGNFGGGRLLAGVPPRPLHRGRLLLLGHLAVLDVDRGHAAQPADLRLDVGRDLVAQRAAGRRERDGNGHVTV